MSNKSQGLLVGHIVQTQVGLGLMSTDEDYYVVNVNEATGTFLVCDSQSMVIPTILVWADGHFSVKGRIPEYFLKDADL